MFQNKIIYNLISAISNVIIRKTWEYFRINSVQQCFYTIQKIEKKSFSVKLESIWSSVKWGDSYCSHCRRKPEDKGQTKTNLSYRLPRWWSRRPWPCRLRCSDFQCDACVFSTPDRDVERYQIVPKLHHSCGLDYLSIRQHLPWWWLRNNKLFGRFN